MAKRAIYFLVFFAALFSMPGRAQADSLNEQLMRAAYDGKFDEVERLLKEGADVNAKDKYSDTPLYQAAQQGHIDVVRLLIEKSADVNAKGFNGSTPLHRAAYWGHIDIVRLLIEKGADVNVKDEGFCSATPLNDAAYKGYIDVVRLLIENGADINAKAKCGTPLHQAAEQGHIDVVHLLIEKGADMNSGDLATAVDNSYIDVARLLIEKGTDVNTEYEGRTPLERAIDTSDKKIELRIELIRLLIGKGADVNAKGHHGMPPLHQAVNRSHVDVDVVRLLIEKGADMNAKDNTGDTPLRMATRGGKMDVAKLLIEKGADVSEGLLDWAVRKGETDLAKLLIEKGADVNAKDDYGSTPLKEAEIRGYKELADLMRQHGGPSKREELDQTMKEAPAGHYLSPDKKESAIRLAMSLTPPPAVPEEYSRFMARGKAAFEIAKKPSDFEAAKKEFEKAVDIAPWLPDTYYNLALSLEKQGEYDYANENYKLYLIAATDAQDIARVKEAIYKNEYLQENRVKADTLAKEAIDLQRKNSLDEAEAKYKKALELNPYPKTVVTIYSNLTALFSDRGLYDEAISYAKKALEIDPNYGMAYNNMGNAYNKKGDRTKAIEYFKKACDLGEELGCKNYKLF